ncbi:MAG: bifunctional 4-hydroxy-3-methylbut-2-enyl diphosphate reductase/30S ribosomal protein S1 [Bacillota bacterium]
MQVKLAEYAGFCSGVKKAIQTVLDAAREGNIQTLGPLVHNESVSSYLADHGVYSVSSPAEASGSTLVIRTHGVTPAVLEQIRNQGLAVIDCTCSRVRRLQRLAAELAAEGTRVIIFGDSSHPEVQGVTGWAGESAVVVSTAAEMDKLSLDEPAALLAQTTGDRSDYAEIKKLFLEKTSGGLVFDTLCPETGLRQEELRNIAAEVDAVVVVGSASSANTNTMVEICRRIKPTCRVAGAGELDPQFFTGCRVVGITAGTSTPHWTIKEVVERMENEEFAAENETAFAFEDEIKLVQVQAGEQVVGKVARVTEDEVFVDIGYKTEALLPKNELYLTEGETLTERFKPGDEIEVTVLSVDDQDGKVVVSHKRLAKEKRLSELEQAFEQETILEGLVKQVVPAGMVIDLGAGLEGFMPGSLVDTRYVPDFTSFIKEKVLFKVIEYNRGKDKVILSRKKVLEEESSREKDKTLRALVPGSVIPGTVRRLTNFGAFVDVGGIDGLVHISELAWERVGHPQEVLKVGDQIEVKVLEVIPEKERISLSLRQVLPDPWSKAVQEIKEGEMMVGKVTRLAAFGAFIELRPGVEGLAHISQIADYHVKHPSEVLKEGEKVEVKILEIKPAAKRISLSVKEAKGVAHYAAGAVDRTADNGNVTLGDVFGDLFDQSGSEKDGAAKETAADEAEPD